MQQNILKERGTYDKLTRKAKENISIEDIRAHWETRAQRPGIQSIMSIRHTLKENQKATLKLQKDILEFIKGYIENKKVFELGVGIGRITSMLAKTAKGVTGNDISSTMLKRAKKNLRKFPNVKLHLGEVAKLKLRPKSFDLVFSCTVLQHILRPKDLRKTIEKMKELSNTVSIIEHTYNGPDFPISKYTILRRQKEYEKLFKPYKLIKQKIHLCVGDHLNFMLFQNKSSDLIQTIKS